MSGPIDNFSTWDDLSCARRSGYRPAYVPRAGRSLAGRAFFGRPDPPKRRQKAPRRSQEPPEPPKVGFRAAWAATWGTWRPKAPRRPPGGHVGVSFFPLSGKRLQNNASRPIVWSASHRLTGRRNWKLLLPRPASRPFQLNCRISTATDGKLISTICTYVYVYLLFGALGDSRENVSRCFW